MDFRNYRKEARKCRIRATEYIKQSDQYRKQSDGANPMYARILKEDALKLETQASVLKAQASVLEAIFCTKYLEEIRKKSVQLREKATEFGASNSKVIRAYSLELREKASELDKWDTNSIKRKIQEEEAKAETVALLQSADMELIGIDSVPAGRKPIPLEWKNDLYEQQKGLCLGCREKFEMRNLSVDHIKPVRSGGETEPNNLQLLCQYCNSKKGTGTQEELIERLQKDGIL